MERKLRQFRCAAWEYTADYIRAHGAHARIVQAARDLGEIFMRRGAKANAADQLVIALEAEETLRRQAKS